MDIRTNRNHGWHMGFYEDRDTANQYIEMAKGFDDRELIEVLRKHLPDVAKVLELGMGPGVDLDILKKYFHVTGPDFSQFSFDRYSDANPDSDLLHLDAVTIETDRVFDGIFSNKVLHHLSDEDLAKSVRRQKEVLFENGIAMHSFWRGEGVEEHQGLKFVYQTEDRLRAIFYTISPLLMSLSTQKWTTTTRCIFLQTHDRSCRTPAGRPV